MRPARLIVRQGKPRQRQTLGANPRVFFARVYVLRC